MTARHLNYTIMPTRFGPRGWVEFVSDEYTGDEDNRCGTTEQIERARRMQPPLYDFSALAEIGACAADIVASGLCVCCGDWRELCDCALTQKWSAYDEPLWCCTTHNRKGED